MDSAGQRQVTKVLLGDIALTLVSDCFDDRRIVEVTLPQPVAIADLQRLSHVSQRTILQDLPRPFFRIDCAQRFLLTGIAGDPRVRFTLRQAAVKRARAIVLQAVAELLNLTP